MGRRQIGILAGVAVFVIAGASEARAGASPKLVTRDLHLRSGGLTARFDLVGLHWRGPGTVRFRTRSVDGAWSAWREADAEEHADIGGGETSRSRGWSVGEPYWVGGSDRIEWRASGSVGRLRAYFVSSRSAAVPPRTLDIAGSPTIVMRSAWIADEELRVVAPRYAPRVRFAVVHHTAGTNSYRPQDSAAIVRGIALYHVKGNGWNDIGYNFLVDQYGQVFEGRHGGIARNVVGAHSAGFNTGSVGIALIGTHKSKPISAAAEVALTRLLAWRLDVAHVDPSTTLAWASGGNGRFPTGTPVMLAAISGHRDVAHTECPGNALYARVPSIASSVAQMGLPKLYDVAVRGRLGDLVRFSGRLSSPQPWTVSVRDSAGAPVAAGSGTGTAVRWTWDARSLSGGPYVWRIEAPSVRPAQGTLGTRQTAPPRPLPPVLDEYALSPSVISPDGDGHADFATVSYRLRRLALVTAQVLGEAGQAPVVLFQNQRQSARVQSWNLNADALPDGRFTVEVVARGGDGSVVRASAPVRVSRTLGFVSAQPPAFSPNGDGNLDTITFAFDLGVPATVSVRVVQYGSEVALVYSGALQPGRQQFVWNGQTSAGTVPNGQYDLVVTAADAIGESKQSVRFTVG